jgi:hypothetical protein
MVVEVVQAGRQLASFRPVRSRLHSSDLGRVWWSSGGSGSDHCTNTVAEPPEHQITGSSGSSTCPVDFWLSKSRAAPCYRGKQAAQCPLLKEPELGGAVPNGPLIRDDENGTNGRV